MEYVIAGVVVFVVILLIGASASSNDQKIGKQVSEDSRTIKLESVYMQDAKNQELFDILKKIYYSGEPLIACTAVSNTDIIRALTETNNIENEHDADYLGALQLELMTSRELTANAPSTGLILHEGESCHFKSKNCILSTIQKLYTTVNYGGFRTNIGAYRNGNLLINAKDVEGFKPLDGGSFYLTNKRIVFIGANNVTKEFPLSSIVSYTPYEDTGILFQLSNNKPIIANFACSGMFTINTKENIPLFHDDRIKCFYSLDSLLGA